MTSKNEVVLCETEVGTKFDQNLATGQVLYQKHLGTAATLIKGGTQEAKFQRLLSLELHATQKRLERPEGEEGRRNRHRACRKTGCECKRRRTLSLTALRTGGPHAREQAGAGRPGRSRAGARWQGTEGDGQSQLMASRRCGQR